MTDKKIGRYKIIEEIGRGGMATVFLAHDPHIGRQVAIKVLPRQYTAVPMFQERFRLEARTIAALEHPAIVTIHDFGEEDGQPFLVMRYMPGGSLADKLAEGALPLPQISRIFQRIAQALDHAHKLGVIHRDLKPGNILFDKYGDDALGNAFLADFGIAKMTEATAALTGSTIIGTPAYMSPEQVKGEKVDGRSDIYTMGVILFELLTGQQPYAATNPISVAYKHVHEPVPDIRQRNADLSPQVQTVINRAMAKEPDERFATAAELAQSVAALAHEPTELPAQAVSPAPPVLEDTELLPELPIPAAPTPIRSQPPAIQSAEVVAEGPKRTVPLWVWGVTAVVALLLLGWGISSMLDGREDSPANVAQMGDGTETAVALLAASTTETATPEPTATATATLTPSATPTASTATEAPTETAVSVTTLPSPTATPTATSCPTPQLRVVNFASAFVRSGPGINYGQVAVAFEDDLFAIIARNSSGSWYNIQLPEGESGWISATVVEIVTTEGCDEEIPLAATIPAPPPPTATPTPTNTNTAVPQPTSPPPQSTSPSQASATPIPTP